MDDRRRRASGEWRLAYRDGIGDGGSRRHGIRVCRPQWRLLILIPVAMAAIGFLQSGSKFCVMVALSSRSPATNAVDRSKDRTKACRMITTAVFIGAVGAALAYWA